jgi:Circularly permutated YpsA SLOG family
MSKPWQCFGGEVAMTLPLYKHALTAPLVIVWGGQTGVDRAALDAALAHDIPCTGWCPEGRMAADGPIDPRYPLHVLAGSGYRARTRENVYDTDGTLILFFAAVVPGGGTEHTIKTCRKSGKPWLELDAAKVQPQDAAALISAFCESHNVRLLNVAGPGASWSYDASYAILSAFVLR